MNEKHIGEEIKSIRINAEVTQQELAKRLGKTQNTYISEIELNKRKNVTAVEYFEILTQLGKTTKGANIILVDYGYERVYPADIIKSKNEKLERAKASVIAKTKVNKPSLPVEVETNDLPHLFLQLIRKLPIRTQDTIKQGLLGGNN